MEVKRACVLWVVLEWGIVRGTEADLVFVGSCVLTLRLRGNDSLKGKRRLARALIAQLRQRFNLAVAEVESMDDPTRLVVGAACVSNRAGHAEEMLDKATRLAESPHWDAELVGVEREVFDI